jgi:hypothetical protein
MSFVSQVVLLSVLLKFGVTTKIHLFNYGLFSRLLVMQLRITKNDFISQHNSRKVWFKKFLF